MASQAELTWWNRFSAIMEKHWKLSPALNDAVRSDYDRDYQTFLLQPGRRLLDVGCGTGWLGLDFARKGMVVDGVDFSAEQLRTAQAEAAKEPKLDIQFFELDLVTQIPRGRFPGYDSAMVNSLLHHFQPEQIRDIIRKVGAVMNPGGRVYFYEPLVPQPTSAAKAAVFRVLHYGFRALLGFYQRYARWRGGTDPAFLEASTGGYGGVSPDETPVDFSLFTAACRDAGLEVEVVPYHYYSLNFCINLMRVDDRGRGRFEDTAKRVYGLDRWLFRNFGWQNLDLRRHKFMFCGIRCTKRS